MPLFVFALAVAYVPGVLSIGTVGRWALITIVGLPVLLVAAVEWFDWSRFETKLGVFLFAWIGASLFWSASPWDTLGLGLHWMALAGLFILAARSPDLTRTWIALALGITVSLPFVILQSFGYEPVWSYVHMGFSGIGGLFMGSNTLAEASTLALLLVLARGRWVYGLAPALCAVLSGRKEVVFMLAVAGVLWFVLERKRLWKIQDNSAAAWLIGITAVAAAINSGMLTTLSTLIAMKFGGTLDTSTAAMLTSSSVERLHIWADTTAKLSILGSGLGTYGLAFPNYYFAHDDALQLEFELGIGALAFFWIIGDAFRATVTRERVALAAFCASALVWAPLQDPTTATLAVVVAGFCCGERARISAAKPDGRTSDLSGAESPTHAPAAALRPLMGDNAVVPARPECSVGS
jgi:hypothetical protein